MLVVPIIYLVQRIIHSYFNEKEKQEFSNELKNVITFNKEVNENCRIINVSYVKILQILASHFYKNARSNHSLFHCLRKVMGLSFCSFLNTSTRHSSHDEKIKNEEYKQQISMEKKVQR